MALAENTYRVIYRDENKKWQIKTCSDRNSATAWVIGHPGALLIRFIDASGVGSSSSYDTLEEALVSTKDPSAIKPKVDGNLPYEGVTVLYAMEIK